MLIGTIVISTVVLLVLISRYRETPKSKRRGPLGWLRKRRFSEQCSYRPDETAKRFAEQWGQHPTLSRREANAIKRSLRKKK